jgi:deoxyhypusine synthase
MLRSKNIFHGSKVINLQFEELKSLDLRRCATVGDIVDGMRTCAFGARMLGEVARTMQAMIAGPKKPIIIYDGLPRSPLGILLGKFVSKKWCASILLPSEYARGKSRGDNAIVVGAFSERDAEAIYKRPARGLFINPFDMAKPGQIRDGFFPDAVFADPRYVMPVIFCALEEWIEGKTSSVASLVANLERYGGVADQVARGAKAFHAMTEDKICQRFLTISGAMTVAKMDLIICDMIELGLIHAISSTGALMAHGLVSSIGLKHYKYNPKYTDTELARRKLNRVTDTLEPETNLDTVEEVIGEVIEQIEGKEPTSPKLAAPVAAQAAHGSSARGQAPAHRLAHGHLFESLPSGLTRGIAAPLYRGADRRMSQATCPSRLLSVGCRRTANRTAAASGKRRMHGRSVADITCVHALVRRRGAG